MANVFFSPFNFQPSASTIETGGYTVPSGKYAYATPLSYNCTLDGVSVMQIGAKSGSLGTGTIPMVIPTSGLVHVLSASGGGTVVFQIADGVAIRNLSAAASSISLTIFGGNIASSITNAAINSSADTSGIVYLTKTSSGTTNWSITTYKASSDVGIWIPSGAVLAGSRWHVAEYNSIT